MIKSVNKKIVLILAFLIILVSGVVGYRAINLPQKSLESATSFQLVPECVLGRCPQYQSLDVDGDGLAESVAVVPTAMTKGVGKVWIIKRSRVIFISKEYPYISAKQLETNNGFVLSYKDISSDGTPGQSKEQNYLFQDGTFKLQP